MNKNNKNILQKIGLIVLGILMSGLISEITLRIMGYCSYLYTLDKNTGLQILKKPNSTFYWTKNCFKNKVKTNSLGFHSKNYDQNKTPGVFRIAIFGDSYTEALQVPLEKTFFSLLEEKLNNLQDKKYRYEVVAFGHSGNGTFLNYLYFKKYGIPYKPDLVIDAFLVGNDFRDDSKELSEKYSKQTGDTAVLKKPFPEYDKNDKLIIDLPKGIYHKSLIRKIARKSTLAVFMWQKYHEVRANIYKYKQHNQQASKILDEELDIIPIDNQVYLVDYPPVWDNIWQVEEKLLSSFNKEVKEVGGKFLLVSLTEGARVHSDLSLEITYENKNKFDFNKPEKLLQLIADKNRFSYLALLPVFKERFKSENKSTYFSCDPHWNEVGHQWAADAIFNYLQKHPELINKN